MINPTLSRRSMITRMFAGLCLLLMAGPAAALASENDLSWMNKVDPWVLETSSQGQTEFLVVLKEQADLSEAANIPTKKEKGALVYSLLSETANQTQPAVLRAIENLQSENSARIEYRSFWIVNSIWVKGGPETIRILAQRPDISKLLANPSIRLDTSNSYSQVFETNQPAQVEWNISKINAPSAWQAGYTGQGAVIGGQDTGYDWDHPALKNQYRGWDGQTAVHDYNWHDAIHENNEHTLDGNPCGYNSPVPCDDASHGTHTMGTMVGDDGLGHQIGVAPGARWIGCRNMEQQWGTPATYMECYQWFIAPTDLNNQNPRPDLAPDVINNSWRCPSNEGCTDPLVLQQAVEAVRAAGILTVQSAGNSGSSCSSIDSPAAIYDASFTVGNTDSNDVIYVNSSRGPVLVDGSGRLKPDISAPGTNIVSSVPSDTNENRYSSMTGTSMAGPHVAGAAALLISARPRFRGQVDAIEERLEHTALARTTTQLCGGIPGSEVPNNTYGWGRLDAWNAINVTDLQFTKIASDYLYDPGQIITYTLQMTLSYTTLSLHDLIISDTIPLQTSFVGSSAPYTIKGSTIVWNEPLLEPDEPKNVDLIVQVQPAAMGTILNENYSLSGSGFETIIGKPVAIYRAIYYFMPWLPIQNEASP